VAARPDEEKLMRPLVLALTPRYLTLTVAVLGALAFGVAGWIYPGHDWSIGVPFVVLAVAAGVGLFDLLQTRHAILRNYPVLGHLRFFFEEIRPEMRQYFFESEKDGTPFSRDQRAIVYQRAKLELDKRPFGTQYDVYAARFEWLLHSMEPRPVAMEPFRIMIGGEACTQPYCSSVLNISAMSYGSLSGNAVMALNKGAQIGNFAHDTGEGGFTPYHAANGGDIVWELGSGYFGARNRDGTFSPELFAEVAANPQIKMVELKLSQGAKPGHGGVLPGVKVTAEIARIRGVPEGEDCISPARHSAFSTPIELLELISEMRRLSGGKPAGFKLCIGQSWEFLAIVKAMLETGLTPDFIVVDGKEGGTGAAPIEFMDHLGMPMRDGLAFVHSALIGAGLRDRIRLGAAGKIVTAFDMGRTMALGADWCNSARAFMFAIGCIQAQVCHTGRCPTGVTSSDPLRSRGLVVPDKAVRVANFHRETLAALAELVAAAGADHPRELMPGHFMRRASLNRVVSYAEIYRFLEPGELLAGTDHPQFREAWAMARADSFAPGAVRGGPVARSLGATR
jgi:glutamate synthase domain-containing protein 2